MNLVTLDVVDHTASRQANEMHGFAVITESQNGHGYVIRRTTQKVGKNSICNCTRPNFI
jgi:hypothetical protein